MSTQTLTLADTGLEVIDIRTDAAYAARRVHVRDAGVQMEGMRRIAHAFVEEPATILQELVKAAVELCDADSAGISIEKDDRTDESFYHWVALRGNTPGSWMQCFHGIRVPAECVWSGRSATVSCGEALF